MSKGLHNIALVALIATSFSICAEEGAKAAAPVASSAAAKPVVKAAESKSFKPFTGRVTGQRVRIRLLADTESPVISEANKGDYLVIAGEKSNFYMVEPPSSAKAYVFRSFVLDNTIEGHHVNIRILPDLDAPVIHHMSTGDKITGKVCEKNNKWIEMDIPKGVHFFVAKDLIEYAGNPELKALYDTRKSELSTLMQEIEVLSHEEMDKPFEQIDHARLVNQYNEIINNFSDFPDHLAKAKTQLAEIQETYLRKKVAFLENRANTIASESTKMAPIASPLPVDYSHSSQYTQSWEPIEEAIYMRWSMHHDAKTMEDFYKEQRGSAISLQGTLEVFAEPVRNKPGTHILRDKGIPVGYLYSTRVDLQSFIGRKIQVIAAPRPNNNFAFPAYYVFEVR